MTIRYVFSAALIGLIAISTSGAPGVEASSVSDSRSGHPYLSSGPEDPVRGDPLLEQASGGAGSGRDARETPAKIEAPRTPGADPWAEAVFEAVRQASAPAYPVVLNQQVQFFLERFTREDRDMVTRWVTRSGRYLGMIRDVLKSRGLPEELAFTAMIESGFNPVAVSRAGAVGLWQFMAATARRYGLRVDAWVDERLDPEKSTFAAAAYLRDLYQQFGSWFLAQAAYNAGEVKIARAIQTTGSKDFWVLARTGLLKQETKEFVPQIQAATLIGRDPNQYGFDPGDVTVVPFETIPVPAATDLRRLASTSGVSMDLLRGLNPTLVRGVTPPGSAYPLKVPAGTGSSVIGALQDAKYPVARSASKGVVRASARSEVHIVRPRDTVTSIARHYGVSVGDLLRWNSLEKRAPIRPGDRLRLTDTRNAVERVSDAR
jgi:membrane-bound lytic murein transglycosylase D